VARAYWRAVVALLSALLGGLVFGSLLVWLAAFAHPLPHWDQWTFLYDYASTLEQGKSWPSFFLGQHNEHRIALPRAIFIADLQWFGGKNVGLVVANIAIQLLSWIGLCLLAWPQLRKVSSRVMAGGLAIAVLFSAAQAENFVWGFQVQFVGVYAAAIWACVFAARGKSLAGGGMAVVATLMMANGLFVWPVLLVLAYVLRNKGHILLWYGAGFAICLCAYLFDFKTVGRHSSLSHALAHPVDFIGYFLTYLGGAGGLNHADLAICLGAALLGMFFLMTLDAWRRREVQRPQFWALWSIAVFVLVSAAVTTVGRMSFGLEQALAGRYVTPSSIFIVSLGFAWACRFGHPLSGAARERKKICANCGFFLLTLTVVGLVFVNHVSNKRELMGRRQRADMTADAIAAQVQDLRVYDMTYNEPDVIARGSSWLKSAHLSIFSVRPWSLMGGTVGVEIPIAQQGRCAGWIDEAKPLADGPRSTSPMSVSGWAWDSKTRRRPPHVLLVDQSNRVTGFASEMIARPDVSFVLATPRAIAAGWQGYNQHGTPFAAYGLVDEGSAACRLSSK
jgi:hypothetical protein